jgi:hypothetical protein
MKKFEKKPLENQTPKKDNSIRWKSNLYNFHFLVFYSTVGILRRRHMTFTTSDCLQTLIRQLKLTLKDY